MKNLTYENEQGKANGGCGRLLFLRTSTGDNRVCGVTGWCDLCYQKNNQPKR